MRKEILQQLHHIPLHIRKEVEIKLRHHLYASTIWNEAEVIGITCSQPSEWDTHSIIRDALLKGKTVAVPKVNAKEKTLTFYHIEHLDQLIEGYQGILEPNTQLGLKALCKNDINLLLVPGLYFDKRGYRIGFGGGYYDRFLVDYLHPTVSLLTERQLVNSLQPEAYDIPVAYLITENGLMVTKE